MAYRSNNCSIRIPVGAQCGSSGGIVEGLWIASAHTLCRSRMTSSCAVHREALDLARSGTVTERGGRKAELLFVLETALSQCLLWTGVQPSQDCFSSRPAYHVISPNSVLGYAFGFLVGKVVDTRRALVTELSSGSSAYLKYLNGSVGTETDHRSFCRELRQRGS